MNWRKILILQFSSSIIRKRRLLYHYYRELLDLEFQPREYIEKYQQERLKELLSYAYRHVPYYSKILKPIFKNGTLTLENFSEIPFLTKDIIRKEEKNLISLVFPKKKTYINTSGGSTGEPVKLIQDRDFWNKNMAIKLFYNHILGKEFGEKELKLWGSERDILKGSIGLRAKIENFLYNRVLLNAFRIEPEKMKEYTGIWNHFKPKSVWAYVDAIDEFAKYVDKQQISMYSPKYVLGTAGTLYEPVRRKIEQVFKTKMFNQYGSREVGDIACECELQEGLHLMEFAQYIEIVDKKGEAVKLGQMGEVVVTLLTNFSMPLIRYKIGDTAIFSRNEPKCGRNFRLLEKVTGRITDHFVKKDGTILHGEYFTHVFYNKFWIKKFQVIQKGYDHIICNIIKERNEDPEDVKLIIADTKALMGEQCKVEIKYVSEIEPSKSGKYLYTISEVTK